MKGGTSEVRGANTGKYSEYNVVSFSGGGAAMSYEWGMDGGINTEVQVQESDSNYDEHDQVMGGVELDIRAFAVRFGGGFTTMHGHSWDKAVMNTKLYTDTDDAFAKFTLADPDVGDYFVVQVYLDPSYGTPLFYTASGASSCHHEGNTADRAMPNIEAKFLDPGYPINADERARFEVTISNQLPYYETGQRQVNRPLW